MTYYAKLVSEIFTSFTGLLGPDWWDWDPVARKAIEAADVFELVMLEKLKQREKDGMKITVSYEYEADNLPGVGGGASDEASQLPSGGGAQQLPADASARLEEAKKSLNQKLDALRQEVAQRVPQAQQKVEAIKQELNSKLDALKQGIASRQEGAQGKVDQGKSQVESAKQEVNARIDELKKELEGRQPHEAQGKLEALKQEIASKVSQLPSGEELKQQISQKIDAARLQIASQHPQQLPRQLDDLKIQISAVIDGQEVSKTWTPGQGQPSQPLPQR